MGDLFDGVASALRREPLADGACVLRGFALASQHHLLAAMHAVIEQAPLRHMSTRGGFTMSVAMTNCGDLGWVSDRSGYRYTALDPLSRQPWPALPEVFVQFARDAAAEAGFDHFVPDAGLINRYAPASRMSLHQDRDEHDYGAPIVSISLGNPATFLFGGDERADKPQRVPLLHGDVVVWGGPSRLRHHGVLPLKENRHPATAEFRFNITLRKAG